MTRSLKAVWNPNGGTFVRYLIKAFSKREPVQPQGAFDPIVEFGGAVSQAISGELSCSPVRCKWHRNLAPIGCGWKEGTACGGACRVRIALNNQVRQLIGGELLRSQIEINLIGPGSGIGAI